MQIVYISQLCFAVIAIVLNGVYGGWFVAAATGYGALLGLMITWITRRSTDRALESAVDNPTHGVVAMFSGFTLRYAVAILGLMIGFKVLHLSAEPMIAGFILMIVVQALAMTLLRPPTNKRDT